MNEQENVALVKQCYDNFLKGDIPQLLSAFSDDINWELPAIEDAPFTGKRHGRDQVEEFFKSLGEMQSAQLFQPKEFIAQGDKVVALGHYVWTVKSTGAQFESDWTHIFTIRGGQIVNFREFLDSHLAEAAYQPQQAGMVRGAGTQAKEGQPARH